MRSFIFKWPHEADEVYVTGTFDNWTKSEQLEKVGQIFQKTVTLPDSSDKIYYKFVVDGNWTTDHTAPQEKDHEGNENNILLPEQMDTMDPIAKLEEASLAAAINSAVPESTTAALAGAVPLEEEKEEKKELSKKQQKKLAKKARDEAEAREAEAKAAEESATAAILNTVVPESTTTQLAGEVPTEKKEEKKEDVLPGGYPETPAFELDQEVSVNPLPAAEGAVNPIKLAAGEPVPRDLSAAAIDTHVTLDEASYEQSDRIPGLDAALPPVTGNMIPESSLPIIGGNDIVPAIPTTETTTTVINPFNGDVAAATIDTVTPAATTAGLAGEVPLEPKVPEVVKKSQLDAGAQPEASAIAEEVKEKAAVEEELLEKVTEAPSTSEGTAGQGTEKSETDKTVLEQVLAAGEVALGAAIVAAEGAGHLAAEAAESAGHVAHDVAERAGHVAHDVAESAGVIAHDVTAQASTAASEAAANLPSTEEVAATASTAASDVTAKASAVASDAAAKLPAAKDVVPGAAAAAAEEKQKNAIEAVSEEVPIQVKESLREAHESPEAAVNAAAVEEKKAYEAELLHAVKAVRAIGEQSSETTAVKPKEETETAIKPKEAPASAVSPLAGATPQGFEPGFALVVEPPKGAEKVKAVDVAKPAEDIKVAEESKPIEETKAADTALVSEPPFPVEEVKAVDTAKPAESSKAVEETKPVPEVAEPSKSAESPTLAVDTSKPPMVPEVAEPPKAKTTESAEPAAPATAAESIPAVAAAEHTAAPGEAETSKTEDALPVTNGATAAAESAGGAGEGTPSERRKKGRFSGFFAKLKHKFS